MPAVTVARAHAPAVPLYVFQLHWIGEDRTWSALTLTESHQRRYHWILSISRCSVVAKNEQSAREMAADRVKKLEDESEAKAGVHWNQWLLKEHVSCTLLGPASGYYRKPRFLLFETKQPTECPYERA
jgi:hypothetical protein